MTHPRYICEMLVNDTPDTEQLRLLAAVWQFGPAKGVSIIQLINFLNIVKLNVAVKSVIFIN